MFGAQRTTCAKLIQCIGLARSELTFGMMNLGITCTDYVTCKGSVRLTGQVSEKCYTSIKNPVKGQVVARTTTHSICTIHKKNLLTFSGIRNV